MSKAIWSLRCHTIDYHELELLAERRKTEDLRADDLQPEPQWRLVNGHKTTGIISQR